MDIHDVPGVTAKAVAEAHLADVKVQGKYDVVYHKYWLNEEQGKVFCLCSAPNAEAAINVHRDAHGLIPQKIIEVAPELADGFLGGAEVNADGAALLPGGGHDDRDSGTRTVLFTDIVESTSLTQRLGDEASMALLKVHDDIVRKALSECGGHEVKHTGDGIMASFISAAAAVRCAKQIQRSLLEHALHDGDLRVRVRIGAASGEPVESNRDLFGSTVQLAARICSHALPEQSLVSNVVVELCIGKGFTFEDIGETTLKGFESPIHLHAVRGS
jgi:class 3 adenylate cyclase